MTKKKTNRSAAKRFKETATGKYKYYHSGKSHILTKKTRKRKRRLRQSSLISPADHQRVRRLLGGGGSKKQSPPVEGTPSDTSTVSNDQHREIMDLLKGQG